MRLPYSRSSTERAGHAVGAEYLSRREQVEPKLIETCELPVGVASVSVSVDRVTVPMEEPVVSDRPDVRAPPLERPSAETIRKFGSDVSARTSAVLHEAKRLANGPRPKIHRNFRMAYCATVTLHDAEGKALHTIRYGRMPAAANSIEQYTHRDIHRMMERLRQDVLAICRRAGPLPVVLLAEGAPELWRLFSEHLHATAIGVEPVQLVDAWHALARVATRWRPRLLQAPWLSRWKQPFGGGSNLAALTRSRLSSEGPCAAYAASRSNTVRGAEP